MTTTIDIRELAARFSEIVSRMRAGAEVIVTDGDIPCARLVSLEATPERIAGLHAGAMQTAPDFDGPLPDDFWAGQS